MRPWNAILPGARPGPLAAFAALCGLLVLGCAGKGEAGGGCSSGAAAGVGVFLAVLAVCGPFQRRPRR